MQRDEALRSAARHVWTPLRCISDASLHHMHCSPGGGRMVKAAAAGQLGLAAARIPLHMSPSPAWWVIISTEISSPLEAIRLGSTASLQRDAWVPSRAGWQRDGRVSRAAGRRAM